PPNKRRKIAAATRPRTTRCIHAAYPSRGGWAPKPASSTTLATRTCVRLPARLRDTEGKMPESRRRPPVASELVLRVPDPGQVGFYSEICTAVQRYFAERCPFAYLQT